MQKRGQTAVFIIIAVVIVLAAILLYLFYPRLSSVVGLESEPGSYIRDCMEPSVEENIALLAKQGGYAEPEGYIMYKDQNVKYLCYTSHYFVPCYVQQPLLREHFEAELARQLNAQAGTCLNEMERYYEQRGYDVTRNAHSTSVDITPGKISITLSAPTTLTKDSTQSFNEFTFDRQSQMYTLLMTANSIIDFESTYGNTETTLFMRYYPNLRIEKDKLGDGSTIYTVSDVPSGESFTFASRSLAWPPGYGLE